MANGAMAVAAAGTSEPRVNAGRRRAAMGALVAVTAMSAAAGARGFVGAAARDPVRMVSEPWRSGAQPLSAANSVPTAAAASEDARPAPWSVVGALVAVHTASVAQVRSPISAGSVGIAKKYGAALEPLHRALRGQ